MQYTYIDDVREWIPDVTCEIVSDDSVTFFIHVAEGDINDALRDRYEVPFLDVPKSIANLCSRYAAYLVMQIFPDANSVEDLKRTGDELSMILEGYQNGTLKLDNSYLSLEEQVEEYFYVSDYTPVYTKDLIES